MKTPNLATAQRLCVGCGKEAKVFDGNWYCGIDLFTSHGMCKTNNKINNLPKQSQKRKK